MKCIIFFLIFLSMSTTQSAIPETGQNINCSHGLKKVKMSYAKGLEIYSSRTTTLLKIKGPPEQNILISKSITPYNCKNLIHLKEPIKSLASISTTHIPFLEALNSLNKLKGFSGVKYISSKKARELLKSKKVTNLGYPLQVEKVLKLRPNIVMAYPASSLNGIDKLIDMGQKVVFNSEFREAHPLGRFEWIKFVGALVGKLPKAKLIFEQGKKNYLSLKKKTKNLKPHLVLTGRNYQGSWSIPGENTYFSKLLQDAGAKLPWNSKRSLPFSFEAILKKSTQIKFWLPQSPWHTKEDILNEDNKYKLLRPYHEGLIYNNNNKTNPWGGNDYWEGALVKPHLLLADLIKIFHPELLPGHTLRWYKKLK
ncbi:ABC transporter substrate-binding protein [Bacteriovoracales bacterium]|nr:ABC transporter substrate-binding protein [Bacteriovoracales bacterium]